ncbi:MAG: hypothetical protein P4M07_08310 [Xanthobacteraceae bacterium]|nr:hypothetical protein [Xanthobacteraceae bacterium]
MLELTIPGGRRRKWLQYAAAVAVGALTLPFWAGACLTQCLPFDQRTPAAETEMFKADSSSVFRAMRNDKRRIENKIAAFVESDPSVLPALRKLLGEIATEDKPAIGAGLRRAVLQCNLAQHPEVARRVEDFVRQLDDATVSAGYVAATEQPEFAPSTPRSKRASAPARKDHLFTGQWNTELADPGAEIALPLSTDSIPEEKPPN